MFATGDNRCPVALFKEYLSRRPVEMKSGGPFYLAPIQNPQTSVWFKHQNLGENAILLTKSWRHWLKTHHWKILQSDWQTIAQEKHWWRSWDPIMLSARRSYMSLAMRMSSPWMITTKVMRPSNDKPLTSSATWPTPQIQAAFLLLNRISMWLQLPASLGLTRFSFNLNICHWFNLKIATTPAVSSTGFSLRISFTSAAWYLTLVQVAAAVHWGLS